MVPGSAHAGQATFFGYCGTAGFANFDPPLDETISAGSIVLPGTGACTGTLNGESITEEPFTFSATLRGDTSCALNRATGSGEMRFGRATRTRIDDVALPVAVALAGPLSSFRVVVRGTESGVATFNSLGPAEMDLPGHIGAQCARLNGRDGVRKLFFYMVAGTEVPLVSAEPPAERLELAVRTPTRQRAASVRRFGLPLRLRANAPVSAVVRAIAGGRTVAQRSVRIADAAGGQLRMRLLLAAADARRAPEIEISAEARHASGASATARAAVLLTRGRAIRPLPASPHPPDYQTVLVSRDGLDGPVAGRPTPPPHTTGTAISADGRRIAFLSEGTNLPGGGSGAGPLLYLKDVATGDVTLVSRRSGPDGAPLPGGNPRVSGSGRHVCWRPPGGTEAVRVRDVRAARTYTIPGTAIGDEYKPNGLTNQPTCAVSDDGRTVVYATVESHDPADRDAEADVYAYDLLDGNWRLVSVDGPQGVPGPLGPARMPDLTPDGRYAAFVAHEGAYVGVQTVPGRNPASYIFRRDLVSGELVMVSRPTGCETRPPTVSENLVGAAAWPSISDDGRYVAFSSGASLDPATPVPATESGYLPIEVYVRDIATCETHLASRSSGPAGAPGRDYCLAPSISGDGMFVAFQCDADNLEADTADADNNSDVFVRAWRDGRTALISRASGLFGEAASGASAMAAISGDKRRVAFVSTSDNLVADSTPPVSTYFRDVIGSRGLLAADRPGAPAIAKAAYRRGRAMGGGLDPGAITFRISEPATVDVRIEPLASGRPLRRHALVEEGANALPVRLRPGPYRVTFAARDLARHDARRTVTVVVPRRR